MKFCICNNGCPTALYATKYDRGQRLIEGSVIILFRCTQHKTMCSCLTSSSLRPESCIHTYQLAIVSASNFSKLLPQTIYFFPYPQFPDQRMWLLLALVAITTISQ